MKVSSIYFLHSRPIKCGREITVSYFSHIVAAQDRLSRKKYLQVLYLFSIQVFIFRKLIMYRPYLSIYSSSNVLFYHLPHVVFHSTPPPPPPPPPPLQISQTQFTLPLQFCSLDCAHTSIHNFTPQRYFSCFSSTLLSFLIFHFRIVSTFDTFPPTSQSLSHCLSSADLLRIPL